MKAVISRKSHSKFQQQLSHTSSTSCWVATKTLFGFALPISTSLQWDVQILVTGSLHGHCMSLNGKATPFIQGSGSSYQWWNIKHGGPFIVCKVSINQNRTHHISPSSPYRKATVAFLYGDDGEIWWVLFWLIETCWPAMAAKGNSSFSQSHETIGSQ